MLYTSSGINQIIHQQLIQIYQNSGISQTYRKTTRLNLLINGEEKFPETIICALNKPNHIYHMEYYIYENDLREITVAELLI